MRMLNKLTLAAVALANCRSDAVKVASYDCSCCSQQKVQLKESITKLEHALSEAWRMEGDGKCMRCAQPGAPATSVHLRQGCLRLLLLLLPPLPSRRLQTLPSPFPASSFFSLDIAPDRKGWLLCSASLSCVRSKPFFILQFGSRTSLEVELAPNDVLEGELPLFGFLLGRHLLKKLTQQTQNKPAAAARGGKTVNLKKLRQQFWAVYAVFNPWIQAQHGLVNNRPQFLPGSQVIFWHTPFIAETPLSSPFHKEENKGGRKKKREM